MITMCSHQHQHPLINDGTLNIFRNIQTGSKGTDDKVSLIKV